MLPWCAPSCPPRRAFVASDARRRGQLCTFTTRPGFSYLSGTTVQTNRATSVAAPPSTTLVLAGLNVTGSPPPGSVNCRIHDAFLCSVNG